MKHISRPPKLLAAIVCCMAAAAAHAASGPPNVVLILTDNHGAWTLGCYGNRDIRTPNIDRLAREGILFERCYASNAVCSPTRATLLTGLIPSQHGVHSYLATGGAQMGPHAYSTIVEFRSLPEILADAGYICGLTGKWHLGDNLRRQHGFTHWVTMPHGHTRTFSGAEVIDDGRVRREPRHLTDFWTDHAVQFINENKARPFFLFVAYNGPYGLGESMLETERDPHAEYYAHKPLNSFPREKMHPWLAANKKLLNNVAAMRRYAAEINRIDDGVGRILNELESHHLDDDTLIIFTADQGLAGGHNGLWGMGDHTRPLTAFDSMTHVPLIYRHPPGIRPGQRTDILVSNYDFLPTMLDYLPLKTPPKNNPLPPREGREGGPSARNPLPPGEGRVRVLPGRSYSRTLIGKPQPWDNTIFFEFETTRAVRTDEWKYVTRFPAGPNELYNVANDPIERRNLIDQPALDVEQNELHRRLDAFFATYADPQYDLTRSGKSKAPRRSR